MEKQLRSNTQRESVSPEGVQQAAEQLATYFYGDTDSSQAFPVLDQERVGAIFNDSNVATWPARLKAIFVQLTEEHQAVAGLYLAGYSDRAIRALGECDVSDALMALRELAAANDRKRPNVASSKWPQAYIPLSMVTDQLRETVQIDEVELKGYCVAINELEPEVFLERMRQLPQYLPAPTKDIWLQLVTGWLDGKGISELVTEFEYSERAIGEQLVRVSKIFLKERSTVRVNRTLTSDELKWQADALCEQTSGEYFFPERGESTRMVKKICDACEVSTQCDDYRKRTGDAHGIWAGKSGGVQRRRSKKSQE